MAKSISIPFLFHLLKIQWKDRKATSAFIVGIFFQNFVLSWAILNQAKNASDALGMASRAALLIITGIVLLSGMSNVQNDFRYGTVSNVLVGKINLQELIFLRSFSTAIVSFPAVLVPYAFAGFFFRENLNHPTFLVLHFFLQFVHAAALCFQISFILNLTQEPSVTLPWVRNILFFFGLAVVPLGFLAPIQNFFPSYYLDRATQNQTFFDLFLFTGMEFLWTGVIYFACRRFLFKKIEQKILEGRF